MKIKRLLKILPSFKKTAATFTAVCFAISCIFSQASAAFVMPTHSAISQINMSAVIQKTLVPFNIGKVTDALYANDGDIVINIQDLHSHSQAQKNISSIISVLDKNYKIERVYVEGGIGKVNTSWISNIKDKKAKEQVLENLLQSGRLTGSEYYAATSNKNNFLQGIEDRKIYVDNLKRLNEIYNLKNEISNYIPYLKYVLNQKSDRYYSDDNRKLNKICLSYENGKISTDKYIEKLLSYAKKAGINLEKYSVVTDFEKIAKLQKSLNTKKLNEEITSLLAELKNKLAYKEYKELIEKSLNKESEISFYFNLLNKSKNAGLLDGKSFKNAKIFFEYITLNSAFNPVDLLVKEQQLIQELNDVFAKTENEKNIYFLKRYVKNLSAYLNNKLTAKDYEFFANNSDKFKRLWTKYIDRDGLINISEYFELFDAFYKDNVERNRVFVKNIFGKLPPEAKDGFRIKSNINHADKVIEAVENGRRIYVVVTGGFHTYGFNKLLEDNGINYIVITPNVTEDATFAETKYEQIFKEQSVILYETLQKMLISQTGTMQVLNSDVLNGLSSLSQPLEIEAINEMLKDAGQTDILVSSIERLSNGYNVKVIKDKKEEIIFISDTDLSAQQQVSLPSEKKLNNFFSAYDALQEFMRLMRSATRTATIPKDINERMLVIENLVEKIDNDVLKTRFKEKIKELKQSNYEKLEIADTFDGVENKRWFKAITSFEKFIHPKASDEIINLKARNVAVAIKEYGLFSFNSVKTFVNLHYVDEINNETYDIRYNEIKSIRRLANVATFLTGTMFLLYAITTTPFAFIPGILVTLFMNWFANVLGYIGYNNLVDEYAMSDQSKFYNKLSELARDRDYEFDKKRRKEIEDQIKLLSAARKQDIKINLMQKQEMADFFERIENKRWFKGIKSFVKLFNENESEELITAKARNIAIAIKKYRTIAVNSAKTLTNLNYVKETDDISYRLRTKAAKEIKRDSTFMTVMVSAVSIAATISNPLNIFISAFSVFAINFITNVLFHISYNDLVDKYATADDSDNLVKLLDLAKQRSYTFNEKEIEDYTDLISLITEAKRGNIKLSIENKNTYKVVIDGKTYHTTAESPQKAFNNIVYNVARKIVGNGNKRPIMAEIRERNTVENSVYLIKQEPVAVTTRSQRTEKPIIERKPEPGDYMFTVVIPGINDTSELESFQKVYAKSPRAAIIHVVLAIFYATKNGILKNGVFENIPFNSEENARKIRNMISDKYQGKDIEKIVLGLSSPYSSPASNEGFAKKRAVKPTEEQSKYIVNIPGINSRTGVGDLEMYREVYAVNARDAVEQALLNIIKAKENGYIRGGYYNYVVINRNNKQSILEEIYRQYGDNLDKIVTLQEEKQSVTPQERYEQISLTDLIRENSQQTKTEEATSKQNENDVLAQKLIQPLSQVAIAQYPELVSQTQQDIAKMLENKIFTSEEIQALIAQLVDYLNGKIPSSIKTRKVSFGTAGARGEMGRDFDFDTVALIAQARANIIKKDNSIQKNFFVANDSRFLGKWFSVVEERIFTANGIQCYSVDNNLGTLSTPAVSYFLKDLYVNSNWEKYGLAKGTVMAGSENITASHNPGIYNGAKPNGTDGAQLPSSETAKISSEISAIQKLMQDGKSAVLIAKKENTKQIKGIADAHVNYLINLFADLLGIDEKNIENFKKNNSANIHIVIHGNHSVLVPEMKQLCDYYGFNFEFLQGTETRDTSFDGGKPEPNETNMTALKNKVTVKVAGKTVFGIASDPDGDRFCVYDTDGTFIHPNKIGLITEDGLLSKTINQMQQDLQNNTLTLEKIETYRGKILKSHVTSSEIDALAQYYSNEFMNIAFGKDNNAVSQEDKNKYLDMYRAGSYIPFAIENLPVGWKNIADRQKQIEEKGERFIMGVESSGGLSLGVYDKDGALATMLPVLVATLNKKDFNSMLADIHQKAGFESFFNETSATLDDKGKQNFLDWVNEKADYASVDQATKEFYRASVEKLLNRLGINNNIAVVDLVVWKNEGLKILLSERDDNGNISVKWIAFRASGTEPKIRIYAETAGYEPESELDLFTDIARNIVNGAYKHFTNSSFFLQLQNYVSSKIKTIRQLFEADKNRTNKYTREVSIGAGEKLFFNFSQTNMDDEIFELFKGVLDNADFKNKRDAMLSGEIYNLTENRAVLHSALRNIKYKNGQLTAKSPIYFNGKDVMPDIINVLMKMKDFSDKVISGKWLGSTGKEITDVVSIGIGGSDLGPRMATEALSTFNKGKKVHFVSNVDPNDITSTLQGLNPETTLFIIESKTFTTEETITNATLAKKWISEQLGATNDVIAKHFVAVSTNKQKVAEFGIDTDNMFEFWDWVGGRFSVWSAVGLPLMCSVGFENFVEFLSGASAMDDNFKNEPYEKNIAVIMAMLNVLERNLLDRNAYAILPYNRFLKQFTAHIQQVYMESLGKSVDIDGERITDYSTGSEIYGTAGTDAQHSYLQEHHQGTDIIPVDFIGFSVADAGITDETAKQSHKRLLSNMLAQASAMALGRTYEETVNKLISEGKTEKEAKEIAKAQVFDGNRPSTILQFDRLSPRSLGAAIALYEDMVATLGIIWNINAFDQMGVELGKVNAKGIYNAFQGNQAQLDSSTSAMMDFTKDSLLRSPSVTFTDLLSYFTTSKNDIELKADIDKMLGAKFSMESIIKILQQYMLLREGKIPYTVYEKTEEIKFGTAGVRGIMGSEFDFIDVAIITQAISNVIDSIAKSQGITDTEKIKVLVGGDSRFMSKQFAEIVSKVLAANGIKSVVSIEDVPSPAISYYTRGNDFTLSINITASHNPKEHNGYKITLGDGGQAGMNITMMIENEIKNIQTQLAQDKPAEEIIKISSMSDRISKIDIQAVFIADFIKMMKSVLGINTQKELEKFRKNAGLWTVAVDPKNGATKTYYPEILKYFGFNISMINDTRDVTFSDQKPEPSALNMPLLINKVKEMAQKSSSKIIGISTDVDGDRFGVVAQDGKYITANEIGLILERDRLENKINEMVDDFIAGKISAKDFLNKKLIIARNCATSHTIDYLAQYLTKEIFTRRFDEISKQAEKQGVQITIDDLVNKVIVKEVNVGFKYMAQEKHQAEKDGNLFLLAIESSGGISVAEWIYDKCGFLANIMLLTSLVKSDSQPQEILKDLYEKINYTPKISETSVMFRDIVAQENPSFDMKQITEEANKRQNAFKDWAKTATVENMTILLKDILSDGSRTVSSVVSVGEKNSFEGIKIRFSDGSWMLLRLSGTEPLVRDFVESNDEEFTKKLSALGEEIVKGKYNELSQGQNIVKTATSQIKQAVVRVTEKMQQMIISAIYKNVTEYTIVAQADDLSRIKKAELLSDAGIKVNLVLVGQSQLKGETVSLMSYGDTNLKSGLMETKNDNLIVYGYDVNEDKDISIKQKVVAMLDYINSSSDYSVKILDLPLSVADLSVAEIESEVSNMFTNIGIGKTITKLFAEALKNKTNATDNMIVKPSLVASNISVSQAENYGIAEITKLKQQGVTTIIISTDDNELNNNATSLKNLMQLAHDNGIKVMFNFSFDLAKISLDGFLKWGGNLENLVNIFKENGGIDGLQIDISSNGVLASVFGMPQILMEISKIVNRQNVGAFMAVKMPSETDLSEYINVFEMAGIKLVADYDKAEKVLERQSLKQENLIINISADKNGILNVKMLEKLFESNKVSMLSFDDTILNSMDEENGFSFNNFSIGQLISSVFRTTPEGQFIKGLNNGKEFALSSELVSSKDLVSQIFKIYAEQTYDYNLINDNLGTNFNQTVSENEIKGFLRGFLEVAELKNLGIEITDASFEKVAYTNILTENLVVYRTLKGESFNPDSSDEIEQVLDIEKFSDDVKPQITELFNILNSSYTDKTDTVINILYSLSNKTTLSQTEKEAIVEGLLLMLLGYARQDSITIDVTAEQDITKIKALLSAA